MTNKTRGTIIRVTATVVSVGAPFGALLSQFPVWIRSSDKATVSGLFLVLFIICCIPFFRQIKEFMKSPSAPIVWTVLAVLFIALRNIADQMVFICAVGALANYIGTALYKLGDYIKAKPDKPKGGDSDSNGGE